MPSLQLENCLIWNKLRILIIKNLYHSINSFIDYQGFLSFYYFYIEHNWIKIVPLDFLVNDFYKIAQLMGIYQFL